MSADSRTGRAAASSAGDATLAACTTARSGAPMRCVAILTPYPLERMRTEYGGGLSSQCTFTICASSDASPCTYTTRSL